MNKENIDWIFNLRIIASFAVIVLHVSSPIVVNYSSIGLSRGLLLIFLIP